MTPARDTRTDRPRTERPEMITEEAIEAAAKGMALSEGGMRQPITYLKAARAALEAAAPFMLAAAVDAPPVAPRPCTERHSHPDPAYMCMAPEGHK